MPGVHIHQDAATLHEYQGLAARVEAHGYDRIWIGEINDVDAVTSAALAASATTSARISTFVNVFTRAPTTLAMTAATLAHLAPGRAEIVLGVGSPLFVERWNGIPYRRIHERLRDTLEFLELALTGERVRARFDTIETDGFRLASAPASPPTVLLAAAGERALALAATAADGVALNWIVPGDIDRIRPLPADRDCVTIIVPMCPTEDRALMDARMRPVVANYLNVPGYAGQHRRLGRSSLLEAMWEAWRVDDAVAARRALPSTLLDEIVVWGSPSACRDQLEELERATGARIVATVFPPPGASFADVVLPDRSPASRR
jgi:probable F420-dependent oxidoreductase